MTLFYAKVSRVRINHASAAPASIRTMHWRYWPYRPYTVYMAVLYIKQGAVNWGRAKEHGQRRWTRTTIIVRPPADQTPGWPMIRLPPAPAPPYARPDT